MDVCIFGLVQGSGIGESLKFSQPNPVGGEDYKA